MVLPLQITRAAQCGDTAAIQQWFSTGTRDPDEKGEDGRPLLFSAAYNGHCDTMRFLLDHGASIHTTSSAGHTPLSGAAIRGKHAAAVLLLDRGAQIDVASNT